jgi:hypothetical protein
MVDDLDRRLADAEKSVKEHKMLKHYTSVEYNQSVKTNKNNLNSLIGLFPTPPFREGPVKTWNLDIKDRHVVQNKVLPVSLIISNISQEDRMNMKHGDIIVDTNQKDAFRTSNIYFVNRRGPPGRFSVVAAVEEATGKQFI